MEYGIIVLKPDGNTEECYKECLKFAKARGLTKVMTKELILSSKDVNNNFYNGHNKKLYAQYLGSSKVKIILFSGENTEYKLYKIKLLLREKFGNCSNEMMNRFHTPDNGCEYYRQFTLFFPELDIRKFSFYADLDIGKIENNFVENMHNISESKLQIIGVSYNSWSKLMSYQQDELINSGKTIYFYKKVNIRLCTWIRFYSDINNIYEFEKIDSLYLKKLNIIEKNKKGFVVYDWNDCWSNNQNINMMIKLGIKNAFVYTIKRSVKKAHIIDDYLHKYGFASAGGSQGKGIGVISIGKRMFDKIIGIEENNNNKL